MSASTGALSGIKVLDLTQLLAGPFCTQMLSDHGADVIKIEPPAGDSSRGVGPFRPDDRRGAFGGYFVSINRNKRSVVIDLKSPKGRDLLLEMVATADVLVENYRLGVMERLGLSYEELSAANPRLVYAALRGFGDPHTCGSPYQEWPAFDVVAQAMGGIMSITGAGPDNPAKIGPGVGDIIPGMYLAFGILAAVRHVEKTGRGQFVDVAMVDSVLAVCERIVHQYSVSGIAPQPEGNQHPMLCPFGLFQARDGWVSIACPGDIFWQKLCERLDLPDVAMDKRYSSALARMKNRKEVEALLSNRIRTQTKAELLELIGGVVPFGPVLDAAEISSDPHFVQRQMIVPLSYPGIAEPIAIAGVPLRFSETPGGVYRRAPLLGEDTESVLHECGVSATRIENMRTAGVIKQSKSGANP